MRKVAQWSQAHVPVGSTIILHDAGYMAFATNFHLIDMVGLKSAIAIPVHRRLTFPTAGAERGDAIVDIVEAANPRPQYLIDIKYWEVKFGILNSFEKRGWTLTPLYESPSPPDTPPLYIYRVYSLTKHD